MAGASFRNVEREDRRGRRPADALRFRRVRGVWPVALLTVGGACSDAQSLQPVHEEIRIVAGPPASVEGPGRVESEPREPFPLAPLRQRICQRHSERLHDQVDVLWVFGLGRSFPWDESLQEAARAFFDTLVESEVDFRLGLIDASAPAEEGGKLIGPDAETPFWSCAGARCEGADPSVAAEAFAARAAALAEREGRVEDRGLLHAMAALSEPLHESVNGGFHRDGAHLSLIVLSDADDRSCAPGVEVEAECTSFGTCSCAEGGWGEADFYVRFFRGLAGFGHADRVSLSAYVARGRAPLPVEADESYLGCELEATTPCRSPGVEGASCALHASRYLQVAARMDGAVEDLCSSDPREALPTLASRSLGMRGEVELDRFPLPPTIEAMVLSKTADSCDHEIPCADPGLDCIRGWCGRAVLEDGNDGWQYVTCSENLPRKTIRFSGSARPRMSQLVEVCYDVDVHAEPPLCP